MLREVYNEISLKELVFFYLIILGVYVLVPEQIAFIKTMLSPVALVTLGAIFVVSLREIGRP
jgi:hypothetical protein